MATKETFEQVFKGLGKMMANSRTVRMKREIYDRAKEFSTTHNRPLTDIVTKAVDFWLQTVGEATTECMVEEMTASRPGSA